MYKRLVAYKKEHNDTNVPKRYKADPQLGDWVNMQRYFWREKKITEERKQLLDSIGLKCDLSAKSIAAWEEMYKRLVEYKNEHKKTNVSYTYNKDPQLGRWVNTQRIAYREKKMTEERQRLLNSIGFLWAELGAATWEKMYEQLVAYKKEHNSTQVPRKYKANPQLGNWVNYQRKRYRNNKMTEERKRLLKSIGFVLPDLSTNIKQHGRKCMSN